MFTNNKLIYEIFHESIRLSYEHQLEDKQWAEQPQKHNEYVYNINDTVNQLRILFYTYTLRKSGKGTDGNTLERFVAKLWIV